MPGAQNLLARTAEPAVSEEDLLRLENERKKKEALHAKRGRPIPTKPRRRDPDTLADVVVSDDKRVHNRSSSRSDSPLTDVKVLSDESTPPLTPMSSKSDNLFRDSLRHPGEKKGDNVYPFPLVIPATTTAKKLSVSRPSATTASSRSENSENKEKSDGKHGKKRKREDTPPKQTRTKESSLPVQQRRKSRPGWKGWVEVEGSPEPRTKLINLDSPIEVLVTRTRSGKPAGAGPTNPPAARSRKTSTVNGSVASTTPAPSEGPLGIVSRNSPLEISQGEV